MVPIEFAKSRATRASVVSLPTCQKRANISFLRANVPLPKTCQFSNLACQRVKLSRISNSSRSQSKKITIFFLRILYTWTLHVFFILLSCFSCGKFDLSKLYIFSKHSYSLMNFFKTLFFKQVFHPQKLPKIFIV